MTDDLKAVLPTRPWSAAPWTVNRVFNNVLVESDINAHGANLANVWGGNVSDLSPSPAIETAHANAELIALAPEMAEAILVHHAEPCGDTPCDDPVCMVAAKLRAIGGVR